MRGGQGCACDEAPVGSQMQWFPTTAASQVCREHHSEWSYKGTTIVTQELRDPTKHKMPPSWTIRLWSTQELCHTHVLWKVQPGQTSFSLTRHCAGRMSNDSVQNQVKKKLFFFFNSRHNETSFGEYYFALGKWLDANLGKKAVPPRAQGQLTPAFKEQETWDKGVGVRMSSLAPRRKRKRT